MKKNILIVSILVAVGLSFAIISLHKKQKNTSHLETVTVKKKNIASSILATGSVKPMIGAEVKVGARISGKVEHLYTNIGDKVEKGQIIAEIEKADLEAQVSQKKAALKAAEAGIEVSKASLWPSLSAETDYGFKDTQYPPQKKDTFAGLKVTMPLFSGENLYSIKQSKSNKEAARAALEYAKVQLSYATITAPISGVIASVSTQEGETVASGLTAPTFVTIIDLNRLQVEAFVDETDIGRVKIGQRAVFTVDTYPDKEFEGVVSAIYPKAIIQENVVNYDAIIDITSPFKGLLRPDMTTSVTIYQEEKTGLLMIPRNAVKKEGDAEFVFVKTQDGALLKKEVKAGLRHRNEVEIVSGLKEGEAVVISGNGAQNY